LEVKNLLEILTDSKSPAFAGCAYSVGLKFTGLKKETVVSLECRTRVEMDKWHRLFRYLKEVRGGVTMPVNVRPGFRMQGDLKWEGSFEEHFEFYCKNYHEMQLHVGETCQQYRCHSCHMRASRGTMFFHVCPEPKCGYSMCTKCAKANSKIGEGGFSKVHLAINKNMVDKPPCVIKIFNGMMGHSALKKMVMETDVLFELQAHPNIVKYQGYGGPNENGQLWMVMEFCDGGSVLDLRKGMKTLMAESHIAYIIHCVLRALAFLHSKGIAHKDIKAANILLTTHGFVKLSDFGISEQVKQNSEVNELAGSPLWMPPEAYNHEQVDQKGDIWSLGITAIELAEGKPPFSANGPWKNLVDKVVNGPPPTLREKKSLDKPPRKDDAPEWSLEFKQFLSLCFAKDPKGRPSAEDLLRDPFMDEDQFKLTTFCNKLMNVMQDAGIFEMNISRAVGEKSAQVQKNVPALICRKSLLYLIRYKNYKEVVQRDEVDPRTDKKNSKEPKMSSIRNRLFGGGISQNEVSEDKKDVNKDLIEWGFIQTLQGEMLGKVNRKATVKDMTTAKEDEKSRGLSIAPMLNLGDDDLTKTREVPNGVSVLKLGTDDQTKSREHALINAERNEEVKIEPKISADTGMRLKNMMSKYSDRFIVNSNETFQLRLDGNDRIFSTANFAIDTSGRMDSRERNKMVDQYPRKLLYKRKDLIHIRHLGRGVSGYVIKSFHIPSKKFVALKHMSIEAAAQRHQLDKELTAFVKVQHPQVLRLEGAYLEGDSIIIVLEYMDLGSLEEVVKKRKKIPEKYLAQMAKQAIEGLRHIHSKRFLHRDIKPDNFLVSSLGDVKVADFGLMRELREDQSGCHTKLGTLCYLAPERIMTEEYSYPSDVWGIGISLIYCATGRNPFPKNYWDLVTAVTEKPPPALDRKIFSENFCDFIDDCLKRKPSERKTGGELLEHPFIKSAASKSELAQYLSSGREKTRQKRAKHELKLLAREIYHNRKGRGEKIFLDESERERIAAQLRVKPKFINEIAQKIWKEATQASGGKNFELWKPEKKDS